MLETKTEKEVYSGSLKSGWDAEAGYERLRFVDLKNNQTIKSIVKIIKKGLLDLSTNNLSRLDLRLKIDEEFSIFDLQAEFPDVDVSVRPDNINGDFFLTIGVNNDSRKLANESFLEIQKFVCEKINNTVEELVNFTEHALIEFQKIGALNLKFESDINNFETSEIFGFWGPMFDWSESDVEALLEKPGESRIYGLRNKEEKLVACVLVSEGESTEWSVCPSLQGKGIITPLLIYAHVDQINKYGENTDIYAHLRYNRSISPAIKSGMVFESKFGTPNILTNHVDVDGNLTHFVEGKVDTSLFTPELIKEILNQE